MWSELMYQTDWADDVENTCTLDDCLQRTETNFPKNNSFGCSTACGAVRKQCVLGGLGRALYIT